MKHRHIGLTKRLRRYRFEFILAALITAVGLVALISSVAGLL